MMRSRWWRFWVKCPTCGARSLRACGARAGEKIEFAGGYYKWEKWNPCSEFAPGGLVLGVDALPPDGGLDDLSDIVLTTDGGTEINTVH